jgi:hypothetical protein
MSIQKEAKRQTMSNWNRSGHIGGGPKNIIFLGSTEGWNMGNSFLRREHHLLSK